MAIYTAFFGALRPGMPGMLESGDYYFPVCAEVVVFDAQGQPAPYGEGQGPWGAWQTLYSIDGIGMNDSLATLRAKVMANLRPQYPHMAVTDIVKAVWLDNGGLLSL